MSLHLDLIDLIRSFYLLSAAAILIVRLIPSLGHRFLNYGAREPVGPTKPLSNSRIAQFLDHLATYKVAHSKFWHFYSLSSACTTFWMAHISNGAFLHVFKRYVPPSSTDKATSPAKVGLCMLLMLAQGNRRLHECVKLSKDRPSTSSMWIGHYLIGMAFYFVTNIAILIEHVHLLLSLDRFTSLFLRINAGPSLSEALAFIAFIAASKKQHEFHVYLASLKKYTLPDEATFRWVVAPHYTAECVIYLSLAILSAPAGKHVNMTVLCAALFVVINLGVTADGTKKWTLEEFPDRRKEIDSRWKMLPGLF